MPTAIVTGGSQGFGLALTARLVEQGWTVVTDARHADRLATATATLDGPGRVVAIAGDVTDASHLARVVAAAADSGQLELVVHNASSLGATPLPGLAEYPLQTLLDTFRVNVVAPVALTQAALPHLAPGGTVVTISSDAAVEAYPGWGGYGASKAALDQVGAVLAAEHQDLHVYVFDPGDMRTAMHQAAFPGEDISDRADPADVVPALLRLLAEAPASGRYRASDLAAGVLA